MREYKEYEQEELELFKKFYRMQRKKDNIKHSPKEQDLSNGEEYAQTQKMPVAWLKDNKLLHFQEKSTRKKQFQKEEGPSPGKVPRISEFSVLEEQQQASGLQFSAPGTPLWPLSQQAQPDYSKERVRDRLEELKSGLQYRIFGSVGGVPCNSFIRKGQYILKLKI